MKGKISFHIKNRQIAFKLELERNITILTGDSGTGKTKLINMVRDYSREGKASGITLKCDKKCIVLDDNNWDIILERTSNIACVIICGIIVAQINTIRIGIKLIEKLKTELASKNK